MTGTEPIIVTRNLTKRYGAITAVDELNLSISEGEIFGLLGPNGAGKTTTILMLLGLTEPTQGEAWVAGYNATREPLPVKRMIGYLPDNVGFYEDMTGWQNLEYTASLNRIPRQDAQRRIESVLGKVGLSRDGRRRVGEYSRGMRQRLGIADVLLKNPRIVILDEPTLGIDPEGVQQLLELITRLAREEGITMLISSHLLHQMQQMCDRVGIFVRGKMIACGPIASLGTQIMEGQSFLIEVVARPDGSKLREVVSGLEGVDEVREEGDVLLIRSAKDLRYLLVRRLVDEGIELEHIRLRGQSLDDIYSRYFQGEG